MDYPWLLVVGFFSVSKCNLYSIYIYTCTEPVTAEKKDQKEGTYTLF